MSIDFRSFVPLYRNFVLFNNTESVCKSSFVLFFVSSESPARLYAHTVSSIKDFGKINAESWQFLSDMIYCNRQEIGKNIHLVSSNPQLRCSLSKARYFDRSRSSRAVLYTVPSVGSQRHTDSRSNADFPNLRQLLLLFYWLLRGESLRASILWVGYFITGAHGRATGHAAIFVRRIAVGATNLWKGQ